MGLFSKEEHKKVIRVGDKTYIVDVTEERKQAAREQPQVKELTREEQIEPKRLHPWQTERGKKIVSGLKSGAKKLDKKIVEYNRSRNIMRPGYRPRRRSPMYNNYNPFGATFDMGMNRPRATHRTPSKQRKKYTVVGGKAYPIAGTGKKKKKKKTRSRKSSGSAFDFDFGNWGW